MSYSVKESCPKREFSILVIELLLISSIMLVFGSEWIYRYYFSEGHYWKWDYIGDAHIIWVFELIE